MKTKMLVVGMTLVLALGGLWVGRAAWRANRDLVSLDVREMPLAQVLQKIERQTWEDVRAEGALDARITLRVENEPLSEVLDRVSRQAGARWSTIFAVYESEGGIRALESALRGDGHLAPAGWTRLAPIFPEPLESGEAMPPPDSARGGRGPVMMLRRGNMAITAGPGGKVEVWSPKELVLETRLKERMKESGELAPSAEEAERIAGEVDGDWRVYYALRHSTMGMEVGRNGPPPEPGARPEPPPENRRFAELTPAQRVRQARQRMGIEIQQGEVAAEKGAE